MPIRQPEPGSKAVLHPEQQWELLQCWNRSCFLPNPSGLAAWGQSVFQAVLLETRPLFPLKPWTVEFCGCGFAQSWEREGNQFESFSVRVMEINSSFYSKGKFLAGNSEGFIWNLNLGALKTVLAEL